MALFASIFEFIATLRRWFGHDTRVACTTPDSRNARFLYQRPNDSISPLDSLTGEHWQARGFWMPYKWIPMEREQTIMVKLLRAIKIDSSLSHDASVQIMKKRVTREVDLLQDNKHRNIAPLIAYRTGDALFDHSIIVPWYDNGTLASWLRLSKPSFAQKLIFLESLASGLAFLASKNIVHSDLKPENILVDHESNAILTDFGIYAISQEGQIIDPNDFRPANTSGGNVKWSSPERLRLEAYRPSDDTYSFGCIALYVLTGVEPYHRARTVPEFWKQQLSGLAPASPQSHPDSDLPPSSKWWEIMSLCWLPAPPEVGASRQPSRGSATPGHRPPMEVILKAVKQAVEGAEKTG